MAHTFRPLSCIASPSSTPGTSKQNKAPPRKGHMREAKRQLSFGGPLQWPFAMSGHCQVHPTTPPTRGTSPNQHQHQNIPPSKPPPLTAMMADIDLPAEGIGEVNMEGLPSMLVVYRRDHPHGQLPQAMWEMRQWYHRDALIQQPKLYTAIRNKQKAPALRAVVSHMHCFSESFGH